MPDDKKTFEIEVKSTGGDAAAKDVAKPTAAIKENTAAVKENAEASRQAAFAKATAERKVDEARKAAKESEVGGVKGVAKKLDPDLWEAAGLRIGAAVTVGAAALGTSALYFANSIQQASRAVRLENEQFAIDMAAMERANISATAGALVAQSSGLYDKVISEMKRVRDETTHAFSEGMVDWATHGGRQIASSIWNMVGDRVGLHADTDNEQRDRSSVKQTALRALAMRDMERANELGAEELDIARLRAQGEAAVADQRERELKLANEIRDINVQEAAAKAAVQKTVDDALAAGGMVESGAAEAEQMRIAEAAQTQRQQAFQRGETEIVAARRQRVIETEKEALATDAIGRGMAAEAQVSALLGERRAREAGDLQQAAALHEKILGIMAAQVPPMERLVMLNAALAKGAQDVANSNARDAANDAAKLEAAEDRVEQAEALLAQDQARAQIALIERQKDRMNAADARTETPEIAAQLKVKREREAEARKQAVLKNEADANAAKLQGLEDALAVSTAKLTNDEDGLAKATIEQNLKKQILDIEKTMTGEARAKAVALAQQTAEVDKQLVQQQRFEKDFAALKGQQAQNWQQQADQRDADRRAEQQDRIAANRILNKEEQDRTNAGLPARTPEERKARQDEILGKAGKAKEAQDRKEKKGALDRLAKDDKEKPDRLFPFGKKPKKNQDWSDDAQEVNDEKLPAAAFAGASSQAIPNAVSKGWADLLAAVADAIGQIQTTDVGPIVDAINTLNSKTAQNDAAIQALQQA